MSKKIKVITCLFGPALVLRMAIPPAGLTDVSSATPTAAKERTQILLDGAKILAVHWMRLRESIHIFR
jgi:hypothetical protein